MPSCSEQSSTRSSADRRAAQYWRTIGRPAGQRWDGGRGVYFDDPSGHLLECITRTYGTGGTTTSKPHPLCARQVSTTGAHMGRAVHPYAARAQDCVACVDRRGSSRGFAAAPSRWERRADMGVPRQEIGLAAVRRDALRGRRVRGRRAERGGRSLRHPDRSLDGRSLRCRSRSPRHGRGGGRRGVRRRRARLATPSGASDATYAFDPGVGVWIPACPLPRPRGAGAAGVIDGRLYVVGGLRASSVADLAVYDPASDTWTELAPMPTARDHLAAGVVDGRLYAVGGRAGGQLFAAVEQFDPVERLVERRPSAHADRAWRARRRRS
jgi:hypothetical protein